MISGDAQFCEIGCFGEGLNGKRNEGKRIKENKGKNLSVFFAFSLFSTTRRDESWLSVRFALTK